MAGTIYTIGHSNHSAEVFFGFLEWHAIATIADVRAIPGSRRHPQFGREALLLSCQARDIAYHWMPGLGGRRRSRRDQPSPHVAWEVPAFRAYADYTDTPEFAAARFVATTDFTDPASVTAAANKVRALTDNGEHAAP